MSYIVVFETLFTDLEKAAARKILADERLGDAQPRILKEIIEPALARINEVTGQENSPKYLGYALEYWADK